MGISVNKAIIVDAGGFWSDTDALVLPLEISIHQSSNITKSPVEIGYNVMDYKVLNPIEISAKAIIRCDLYETAMQELQAMYLNRDATTYSVQTKTDAIDNLILYDLQEIQDTEHYDAVVVNIKFCQLIFATVSSTPRSKDNAPKQDTGIKNPVNKTYAQKLANKDFFMPSLR